MTKRPLAVRLAAVANAILLVAFFVGCPRRKDSNIVPPTISPVIGHFEVVPAPIATPPAHFDRMMPPSIAPPPVDFQRTPPPPVHSETIIPPGIAPVPIDFQPLVPSTPTPKPKE